MRNHEEEEIILPEDPRSATPKIITVWVANGQQYSDEMYARSRGATHFRCECGEVFSKEKHWRGVCGCCESRLDRQKYLALPFKEWDGSTPLSIYRDDKYFLSEDEVFDYADDNEIELDDLELVICEPKYACERSLDYDHFADIMPEDATADDYPELADAIEEFNEKLKAYDRPVSWLGSNVRTAIKPRSHDDDSRN